jgi:ankyrin repeat protein
VLLQRNADPNIKNNGATTTALMEAARWGHVDAVRLLLDAGADATLKNTDGQTAFDVAATQEISNLLRAKIKFANK